MLIFRVEDEEEQGCYTHRSCRHNATRAHDLGDCLLTTDKHPVPFDDRLLSAAWGKILDGHHRHISSLHVRFGFASAQQYYAWFHTGRARQILGDIGLHISVIDVPHQYVEVGRSQCVFHRRHATRIGRMPCVAAELQLDDVQRGIAQPPPVPTAMSNLRDLMTSVVNGFKGPP